MRATFNDKGELEIYPDNGAEVMALRGWDAHYPVATVHENFIGPLAMRPAASLIIKESTDGK